VTLQYIANRPTLKLGCTEKQRDAWGVQIVYTDIENLEDQMEDGPTGFESRKGLKWPYFWFDRKRGKKKEDEDGGVKVGRTGV
jgi:hypothetical protein